MTLTPENKYAPHGIKAPVFDLKSYRDGQGFVKLPDPPVPANLYLGHVTRMPLDIFRIQGSHFALVLDPASAFYGIMLWTYSWNQSPPGSLPDNDRVLASILKFGRSDDAVNEWLKYKKDALYGFYKCSDGRLYHNHIAELVLEASEQTNLGKYKQGSTEIDKRGYIYTLINPQTGFVKIGKSKNPEDRLRVFEVKIPFDIEPEIRFRCVNYSHAESSLHKYFADHRLDGEWFDLTSEQAQMISNQKLISSMGIEVIS